MSSIEAVKSLRDGRGLAFSFRLTDAKRRSLAARTPRRPLIDRRGTT